MNQMIPEALPVRVEVSPTSRVDVRVDGPYGLRAKLRIPDSDEAYEVLEEFVAALPQAIEAGLKDAQNEAAVDG